MSTLEVGRELTIYQVADLRAEWLAAYAGDLQRVDLSRVAEVDASGVQLLAALQRLAVRDGRRLPFIDPSPVLLDTLAVLGASGLVGDASPAAAEEPGDA